MRVLRRLVTVAAGICAAAAVSVAPAQAESAWVGSWTATDTDGSNLFLDIDGAQRGYGVRGYDDWATVCGGAPAIVTGSGQADGDQLVTRVNVVCKPGGSVFRNIVIVLSYDANSDTLVDQDGIVYSRA